METIAEGIVEAAEGHRTQDLNARLRREDFEPRKYASFELVVLSPLPCWQYLSPQAYRLRIAELLKEIERKAREERKGLGIQPMGPKAILAQNPHDSPTTPKKSPVPLFHVFKKAVRKAMWEGYAMFVAAFQEAAEKLRGGDPTARFPIGSFPPHLPFVSST